MLIVDDSITVRSALSRIVASRPDMEVVGMASSAEVALDQLGKISCDVILLDLEMPGMGGFNALPRLLEAAGDAAVIVVSSLTTRGAEPTVRALAMGAADTWAKPSSGQFDDRYRGALLRRIYELGHPRRKQGGVQNAALGAHRAAAEAQVERAPANATRGGASFTMSVLAIGASTGGIHALSRFFAHYGDNLTAPILVTQHLPGSFMPVFASQVANMARRPAVVASEGMVIEPGRAHIAPGDGHLMVKRQDDKLVIHIGRQSVASGCCPSVDPMLESLAKTVGRSAVAVILSGMGRDGSIGAGTLAQAGGTVLAQDAESCAVYGMPRGVVEAGLASLVAPPEDMAEAIGRRGRVVSWK